MCRAFNRRVCLVFVREAIAARRMWGAFSTAHAFVVRRMILLSKLHVNVGNDLPDLADAMASRSTLAAYPGETGVLPDRLTWRDVTTVAG